MKIEFENAHCHTYYSNPYTLPDSTMSMRNYAAVYKERGMRCLSFSEHGYRGQVWDTADIAEEFSDDDFKMKPLCSAEVYFVPDRNPELKDGRNFHLLLIAKDNTGFKQLNRILSESQMTGYYKNGRVDFDLLSTIDYRHFLCTTACIAGVLRDPEGERYANQLHEIFKENFRLEVQYHNNNEQIKHNAKVLKLYEKYKWPLFFATDSHYINHEDKILRKELQLSSKIEMDDSGWDLYLPTAEEAYRLMLSQRILSASQIEEAFENTLELRDFEGFSYTSERKFPITLPRLGTTQEARNEVFKKMVIDGYRQRAGEPTEQELNEIHKEMNIVLNTGSADYFVSSKDFLDRAIEKGGILTKTSRGSGASFVLNYALGFTAINRLHSPVTMYPERFCSESKMRVAMPDLDLNLTNLEAFEEAGKELFGEYGFLPMVAYGTTKTSSAFKLLARARNIDFETQNAISKQIQNYELDVKHAKENNQDDPDYDVNEEIKLENYVEQQYIPLVNESKQYQGIITTCVPHPCGHIVYHSDLREDIGIIRLKSKTGNKEARFCACIDGATADRIGYVKEDLK